MHAPEIEINAVKSPVCQKIDPCHSCLSPQVDYGRSVSHYIYDHILNVTLLKHLAIVCRLLLLYTLHIPNSVPRARVTV